MDPLTDQIERTKASLDRLPSQLYEARRILAERRKEVEGATTNVKDLEAEILAVVSGELNEANKPVFSNKEAREAEVRNRLRQSGAYRQLKEQLEQAETARLNAELALNKLQDEERSLDRMLDAIASQIRADSIRELSKTVVELTALEARRLAGMGAR